MLPLALGLLALAVGVGLWTVLSSADEKATVRASLTTSAVRAKSPSRPPDLAATYTRQT